MFVARAQKLANQDPPGSIMGTVDPDGNLKKSLEETRSSVEDTEVPSPASPSTANPSAAGMEIQDTDAGAPDAPAVVGGQPVPLIKPPSLGTAKSAAIPSKETADDTRTVKKPRAARKAKPKAEPKSARKAEPAAKPASPPRKKRAGSAKPAAVTKTAKSPKASNAKSATPSGKES